MAIKLLKDLGDLYEIRAPPLGVDIKSLNKVCNSIYCSSRYFVQNSDWASGRFILNTCIMSLLTSGQSN